MQAVPQLEDVVMMRGLPRRRSEPSMATMMTSTGYSSSPAIRRNRSISCIREVWINLNKAGSYGDQDLAGGYGLMDQLLHGTLYPIDDPDILYWEREHCFMEVDPDSPYVPHGVHIEHNFIDDAEVERIESPSKKLSSREPEEPAQVKAPPKVKPLVMQQVEMLEAKWQQLKVEYGSDNEDSDDDEDNLNGIDVNDRIVQLMSHIEQLELERQQKLAELKRQEQEEENLARKRMVRGGQGINYEQELNNKDFVIRKKKKKKVLEDFDLEDFSEESSDEEIVEDGEFDVKWMRLKVPLTAQNPEAIRTIVETGKGLED